MELLLILSAMLSAVTGVFAGVRDAEAQVQRTEAAAAATSAVAAPRAVTTAMAPALPAADAPTTEVASLPLFVIVAAAPLDAVRLIE